MANGALDSYLQVQLINVDIVNVLPENGQLDNETLICKLFQIEKKKKKNSKSSDNFAHKKNLNGEVATSRK